MKYYCIAGEASGDLHGSNLVKALLQEDEAAQIRGWGGPKMQAAGATIVKDYKELAFMGFVEVALNIRTILGNFKACKTDILAFAPDVLILIDYPGFNLRMAKWAHQQGIRVYYYISPQLWAWHSSRVKQVQAYVDRMFVILPFEEDFYRQYGVEVDFVGHPLLDALDAVEKEDGFIERHGLSDQPIVAILPGSRKQEIQRKLPVMTAVAAQFPGYQFVIAGVSSQDAALYQQYSRADVPVIMDDTYQLLLHSSAALVTSGTATLETALLGVPEVVCYKGGALSYQIGKRLVNVDYISLVNLIMEQELVTELIQDAMNPKQVAAALQHILTTDHAAYLQEQYALLRAKLGGVGASQRAAALMVKKLSESQQKTKD